MASQEGTSQDQTVDPGIDQKLQTHTLAETLEKQEQCGRLAQLIRDAGLEYVLRRSGLHTLFAPTDEALNPTPADMEEFLNRHLVSGGMESFDLRRGQSVKNLAGEVLPVQAENGSFRIGKARIVRSDIPCTNGVIHVVDGRVS